MPEWREVPIRNLPEELTREVHQIIRLHSVTMVVSGVGGTKPFCVSGTLTRVAGMAGILTARHVWEQIERASTLTLLVGGLPYDVDPQVLRAFGPRLENTLPGFPSARVPDLAFICIPPVYHLPIEAYGKVFYSIDLRRQNPEMDVFSELGFWILTGSPQVLFNTETGMAPSFLYDTTVEKMSVDSGDWDYLFVNLNLRKNPKIPRDYGGVSGGGIWRASFYMSEDQSALAIKNPSRDIVLSGVAFYQTNEERRQIIGHGPKSLYSTLYEHISD